MLNSLKKMIRPKAAKPQAFVPEGTRYYAIGDIHGCNDLFEALMAAIDDEIEREEKLESHIVMLGDLVDRGPESAKVIANARAWKDRRSVRFLAGNHEEMFLQSFEDVKVLRHFLRHGGRETILSYGVDEDAYNRTSLEELQDLMRRVVPKKDRKFLKNFEELIEAGDYVFVHAGIRPERNLNKQKREDLLWIRERFLDYDRPHPRYVVHGHTIFEDVDVRSNRIGVDTGAFRFGILTALVLEGGTRRIIQSIDEDGKIAIKKKDLPA